MDVLLGFALVMGLLANVAMASPPSMIIAGATSTITALEFTLCYSGDYTSSDDIADILAACNKGRWVIGCRPMVSPSTVTLALNVDRNSFLSPIGMSANSYKELSGGVWVYFDSRGPSMGFSNAGEAPNRVPCSSLFPSSQSHLCWPVSQNLTGSFLDVSGGRCGTSVGIDAVGTERFIYHRDYSMAPSSNPITSMPSASPSLAPTGSLAPTTSYPTWQPTISAFSGVEIDLSIAALDGWTVCFSSDYGSSSDISAIFSSCDKNRLLLACRPVGSSNLTVAAWGPRGSVLTDVGSALEGKTVANGVNFYYSDSFSWGFSPEGEDVERTPCGSTTGFPGRLCWPTSAGFIDSTMGRCGDTMVSDSSFLREIYQVDDFTGAPSFLMTNDPSPQPTPSSPSMGPSTSKPSVMPSRGPSTQMPTLSPLAQLSGYMTNVDLADLEATGWSVCHTSSYSSSVSIQSVLSACGKQRMMLACRTTGNTVLSAAAQWVRADLLQESGPGTENCTTYNGAKFYYSYSWSWGVGPGGAPLCERNAPGCSTSSTSRVCWPTSNGQITVAGGRCGAPSASPLSSFDRVILVADEITYGPSRTPSRTPSGTPSSSPSSSPTTSKPSRSPSRTPSRTPSHSPSHSPSYSPSSSKPTASPLTSKPSRAPSHTPSRTPSFSPSTSRPSKNPSVAPSTSKPSRNPSRAPSRTPSRTPSYSPTKTAVIGFQTTISRTLSLDSLLDVSLPYIAQYPVNVSVTIATGSGFVTTTSPGPDFAISSGFLNFTFNASSEVSTRVSTQSAELLIGTAFVVARVGSIVATNVTVTLRMTIELTCQPGATSLTGTNVPVACVPCTYGEYSTSTTTCLSCPVDLPRTASTGSTSSAECLRCGLGKYCPIGQATPLNCPARGGYESIATGEGDGVDDRDPSQCESIPCEMFYWCGAGAAENISYVKAFEAFPVTGSTVIRSQKNFQIPIKFPDGSEVENNAIKITKAAGIDPWNTLVNSNNTILPIPIAELRNIPVRIDSTTFEDIIDLPLHLQWRFMTGPLATGERFNFTVPVDINIFSLIVTPSIFDYSTNSTDMNVLVPQIPPIMEVYNTLCAFSVNVQVERTNCNGDDLLALAPWFSLSGLTPFSVRVIEIGSGVALKVPFELNASALVVTSFPQRNQQGTPAATRVSTCLKMNLTINGLDVALIRNVDISFRLLRPCPPGTFSVSGTDSDGCFPCAQGTYQPSEAQSFCNQCPQDFPRTASFGAINITECLADRGAFMSINGTKLTCPGGADCDEIGVTVATLKLLPGYWRSSPLSTSVFECPNTRYCAGGRYLSNVTLEELVPLGLNVSGRRRLWSSFPLPTASICYPNHTGTFCYGCMDGFFKRTGDRYCMMCTAADYAFDAGKLSGIFIAITIAILGWIFFVFISTYRSYRVRRGQTKRSKAERRANDIFQVLDLSIILQILIGFLQVVSGMSITFVEYLPSFYGQLQDIFSVLALDLINIVDFGCTLSAQNHYTSLLISTLLPIGFMLVVLLIHVCLETWLVKKEAVLKQEMRVTLCTVFLVVLFLIYPSCSNKILATFSCRTLDDGSSTITVDPSLSCQTSQYTSFTVYAGFMVLVYPIGVPLVYGVLLYRESKKINPFAKADKLDKVAEAMRTQDRSIAYLHFLWQPYRARYYWFEIFELLRKLFQTSIVVFIAPGTSPQIVFQLIVTVVSVVIINSLLPYIEVKHNLLAITAQWSIFGISLVILLTKFNRTSITNVGTAVGEYNQNSLNQFMVFLFFVVPVMAIVFVIMQVLEAYKIVFFCVKWNKVFDNHPRLEKIFRILGLDVEDDGFEETEEVAVLSSSMTVKDRMKKKRKSLRPSFVVERSLVGVEEAEKERAKQFLARSDNNGVRQTMKLLESLAIESVARKKDRTLVDSEEVIDKWRNAFHMAKVEWESGLEQQLSRADALEGERDEHIERSDMLEEQLKDAMIKIRQLEQRQRQKNAEASVSSSGQGRRVSSGSDGPGQGLTAGNPIFTIENTRTQSFEMGAWHSRN